MNKKSESKKFSLEIEKIRRKKKLSYMEAIIYYCEQYDFDIELVAKIIDSDIKTKIRIEAENLHFIQPKNRRLPI